ncbi:hypothetical protein O181_095236 [Austropuccinia psidii MF-1]|uniref:Uncharacterized protein n=1 Tax=Austropuccinia psidii MF-1 TaxID=1389203 RepID=A0A9Q3J4Q3_9BASI|nr:hypothetical protein [Austropuccinia psidii MF-1]
MSLKAQTHFNNICNVWVLTPHGATQHLQSLRSCGALKLCLGRCPHPRLILSAVYHPYARGMPSQHASDAAYRPYARGMPSQHASNAAYRPYARIVPARNASNAAYHPYTRSALLTCLQFPPQGRL